MSGLYQPIAAIAPEAPAASILTAARQLPVDVEDWRSGVSWLPNGCNSAHVWPICQTDPLAEKCSAPSPGPDRFEPWTIYVPEECLVGVGHGLDYNERVRLSLLAYQAGAVSRVLATGEGTSNPSLESTAAEAAPGSGAVDITTAISLLLQARMNNGFYGSHTFHVPLWLIPHMEKNYLIGPNGTTAMGIGRVSPGPNYPGRNPAVLGPPVEPAAGRGWVYVTGPVEFALGPVSTPMERENQNPLVNRAYHIAERPAILRFDTCGVFAIEALSCTDCSEPAPGGGGGD